MATRAIPSQRSSATKSIRLGAWLSGSVAALLLTQGSAFAQNKPNFTQHELFTMISLKLKLKMNLNTKLFPASQLKF